MERFSSYGTFIDLYLHMYCQLFYIIASVKGEMGINPV